MSSIQVPLPEELHRRLREEAQRTHQSPDELVRQAVSEWLESRRRQHRHDAIVAYARAHAAGEVDLDEALEETAVDELLRATDDPAS